MEGDHDREGKATEGGGAEGPPAGAVTPPAAPTPPPPPVAPPAYAPPQYGAPQQPAYPPQQYGAPPQPAYPPQQYGAPQQAPPAYAPAQQAPPGYAYPPPQPGAPMPVPGAFAPPPAAKRGGSRTLLIVAIVAVFLILVLGGGAVLANASLSSTYSPKRAVTDYFAAQARGDVSGMMSNATFLQGDSAYASFFTKDAITAMMGVPENKDITKVSVTSTQEVDSSTSKVTVSMTWAGNQHSQEYTVRKDQARVHDLFYYSWRVDIPTTTINVTLPKQAGSVQVDSINAPSGSISLQVIQGYHVVAMLATVLYDATSQTANAVDATASVTFPAKLGTTAMQDATDSIHNAFKNVTCDAVKYYDCPNHPYTVRAGYYDVLPAPGGDIRADKSWSIAFTGDPTTSMALVVTSDAGKVTASGKCTMTLTVDGSKTYNFTGTWTGTLTWSGTTVSSDVIEDCDSARA